ncbi:MAG: hypothetical protein A2Y33_15205 [Spirochaetes bacterium GWF1_51_8]|nr:MAG: hypothetical protein A2Y33_15205 [Spirochaetes bacterium GWF1_51_8]
MAFIIKPETRTVSPGKKARFAVMMAFLAISAGSLFGSTPDPDVPKTAGVPYDPMIRSIAELNAAVDYRLTNSLNIGMKHNVALKLDDGSGKKIEFIADGYNPEKKIAYEWVSAPEYSTNTMDTILDLKELSYLVKNKFGDTFIFVIKQRERSAILTETDIFINDYKTQIKKEK